MIVYIFVAAMIFCMFLAFIDCSEYFLQFSFGRVFVGHFLFSFYFCIVLCLLCGWLVFVLRQMIFCMLYRCRYICFLFVSFSFIIFGSLLSFLFFDLFVGSCMCMFQVVLVQGPVVAVLFHVFALFLRFFVLLWLF